MDAQSNTTTGNTANTLIDETTNTTTDTATDTAADTATQHEEHTEETFNVAPGNQANQANSKEDQQAIKTNGEIGYKFYREVHKLMHQ